MSEDMLQPFDEIKARLNTIDGRLGTIDVRLDGHDKQLQELASLTRNNTVTLAVLVQTVQEGFKRMVTKDDLSVFKSQVDDFAREVETSRRERALQDASFNALRERLDDHELRLTRVERRGKPRPE